jgi:hypothetical protein
MHSSYLLSQIPSWLHKIPPFSCVVDVIQSGSALKRGVKPRLDLSSSMTWLRAGWALIEWGGCVGVTLLIFGAASYLHPVEEPVTEPERHCTAKVPMKMHPSPVEVKYYGDEKYEYGLVLKAHRAPDDKQPISVETFEKELNGALKKASVNDTLHLADLMSKDSPLVLVSTKKPVTAQQAVKIFEALHDKMCKYHVTLGQINWPTQAMSKGYELDGKDIQIPTEKDGYEIFASEDNRYVIKGIKKYITNWAEHFGLFYFSDEIGMWQGNSMNDRPTQYFRKGTPQWMEAIKKIEEQENVPIGSVSMGIVDSAVPKRAAGFLMGLAGGWSFSSPITRARTTGLSNDSNGNGPVYLMEDAAWDRLDKKDPQEARHGIQVLYLVGGNQGIPGISGSSLMRVNTLPYLDTVVTSN